MRAISVFVLTLAIASPAFAGPENSVIGGKKLESEMVHNAGVGYPSVFYEWWNRGKGSLDWGIAGELVYGDWTAANVLSGGRFIKIGFAVDGILRFHLVEKQKTKVTNDVALLIKPGVLLAGNRGSSFTFGIRGEVGAPVSIDFNDRFSLVTGGFVPITWFINSDGVPDYGWIPLLIRLGAEFKTPKNLAPWVYFDLGPGIAINTPGNAAQFAWRIAAGTTFWGVRGKKNKSKDVKVERNKIEPILRDPEETTVIEVVE